MAGSGRRKAPPIEDEPALDELSQRQRRRQEREVSQVQKHETMAAIRRWTEEASPAQAAKEQPLRRGRSGAVALSIAGGTSYAAGTSAEQPVSPSVPRKPRSARRTLLRPALLQIQGSPLEEHPVRRSARAPRPRAVSPAPHEANAEGGRKRKREGGRGGRGGQGMLVEDERHAGAPRPRRVSFAPHECKQKDEEDGGLQPDTAYRRRGAKADMRSRKHRAISQTRIDQNVDAGMAHPEYPCGTFVWAKLSGLALWPGIVWSIDKVPAILYGQTTKVRESFVPGTVLVHFRGDHTYYWVHPKSLRAWSSDTYDDHMMAWGLWCAKRPNYKRFYDKGCEEVNATGGLDYEETLALVQREQALRPAGKRLSPVDHELYQRAGLTPDWLIEAGCAVFDLKMPTLSQPRILGLLDPCTNNLIDPNIPAEIVYDRELDGLRLSNSWAGKYIILNPDFDQQIMWRFVNRAIDEVENGSVPGVLLLCRNSTDTKYFQRLGQYPRAFLRQNAMRFKDYDTSPIGFGIALFCIIKGDHQDSAKVFSRFYEQFSPYSEINMPVDRHFVDSEHFMHLVKRLQDAGDDTHWTCSKVVAGCHVGSTRGELKWKGYARNRETGQAKCPSHWTSAGSAGTIVEEDINMDLENMVNPEVECAGPSTPAQTDARTKSILQTCVERYDAVQPLRERSTISETAVTQLHDPMVNVAMHEGVLSSFELIRAVRIRANLSAMRRIIHPTEDRTQSSGDRLAADHLEVDHMTDLMAVADTAQKQHASAHKSERAAFAVCSAARSEMRELQARMEACSSVLKEKESIYANAAAALSAATRCMEESCKAAGLRLLVS